MAEFEIISQDGLRLFGYEWKSDINPESPLAVIILLHGVSEHCARYKHLAQFYNQNDIAVMAMDLRGHGLSGGEPVFIPKIEAIFQDIDILIEEVRYRYPSCPAILYGHSMGGTLALSYTYSRYSNKNTHCPYNGLIASSPWIRLARYLQPPRPIAAIIQKFSQLRPSLKVPLKFNANRITRDSRVVDAYKIDPYVHRSATLSLTNTIGRIANQLDKMFCRYPIPVLIQHGTDDSITSHDASLRFANRGENISFKSWPYCYHELHNEPEQEEIFHFTLDWISENVCTSYM